MRRTATSPPGKRLKVEAPPPAAKPDVKDTAAAAAAAAFRSRASRGQLLVGALAPAPPAAAPAAEAPASSVETKFTIEPRGVVACREQQQPALQPPLPEEFRRLQKSFLALETTLSFFRSRGEPAFFRTLCSAVERNTSQAFSERTLRLIRGVWPDAFAVEAVSVLASRGRPATTDWLVTQPPVKLAQHLGAAAASAERRAEFYARLLTRVRAAHDAWLCERDEPPPAAAAAAAAAHERAWHADFPLESCTLPAEGELPDLGQHEPPGAARSGAAAAPAGGKAREAARRAAARSGSAPAADPTTSAPPAPPAGGPAPPAPAPPGASRANAPAGCAGLPSALIAKIQARQSATERDDAAQAPLRRANLLAHLPLLARSVRSILLAETGGGATLRLPLDDLVRLLQQSKACVATASELREQLALLAAEKPCWYAHVETHRGTYAKVDNRRSFQQVLAELRPLKEAPC